MGQAYATTFEFNGIEHAILISDRHPPHERLASFYEDHKDFDPYSELNKVQLCGKLAVVTDPIILDFSDKKFSNEHVGLDFDLLQGYACIETEQFEGKVDVLAIGFDNLDGPFIGSFTATPDGEIIHKPQRIHYLREPSDTSQLNVRQMSNPEKGMLMRPYVLKFEKEAEYADQEFGDMAYAPTLDAVVNNLREMILHDTSQRGTSKNVDIVIAGPTSRWLPRNIVQFSHYSELPDMWIQEEEQTGYPENQGEPVPQAKFFERFKNDVKIRNNPKANFMYRLLLSGMQEVKEEFTKYQVGAAFYYAKGWENDPIKTEIHHVHGYAPRELLSKRKLKKRLNWAQTVFDEYMGIFQSSRNLK